MISDGRAVETSASFIATASQDGDGNETRAEANVEDDGDEGEDGNAAQETSQTDGKRCVDDGRTLVIISN